MARRKRVVSATARAKASARMKGKQHPHKGHKISASTRARIARALKGKHPRHKGHRLSATTRAKISARLKGHHHKGHRLSAATRAKIAARLKGRHRTAVGSRHPTTMHPRAAASAAAAAHRTRRGRRYGAFRPSTHFGLRKHHAHNTRFGLIKHHRATHFGRHHIRMSKPIRIRRRRR
ncbi:NUMOD3 domain-containing DNA-binding protein [Streptomyces sp. CBMA152]|uniref:NUMOD3 domain-containing DNA-binding protein n=1 Tax=Streptomyces sp. CBMA152 TaxID=1896312 RepID=UPI001660A9B6|nr:NUMOD3 domain-containing DNA-binding protein [Streptomyces sp. CBMA152]MBD0743601.1 hypothetical protein [Streptomyces sp. CBMA152]